MQKGRQQKARVTGTAATKKKKIKCEKSENDSDNEGVLEKEENVNDIIRKIADNDSEIVSGGEVEMYYWQSKGQLPPSAPSVRAGVEVKTE